LAKVADKEIMVYVHGTKVDFTNAAVLAAEVEHFAGRDFVSVAYAWPSHQNILSYLFGIDVQRARESSTPLVELLVLLAVHSDAEKIHLLSYSAGGRVTSKALVEMRQRFTHLEAAQLKEQFRLGSVIFAAADVELDVFLERLKAASDFADQVIITISDKDNALQAARRYMGGPVRAGTTEAETAELAYIDSAELENVSIIDVSIGQDQRGFDIVGHHYWYRHPWMSSDIMFLMRTDLPPDRRGLQPTEITGLWYLSADYPRRVRDAAATEIGDQW
jgi:esterase/lipase superfamily enzyme